MPKRIAKIVDGVLNNKIKDIKIADKDTGFLRPWVVIRFLLEEFDIPHSKFQTKVGLESNHISRGRAAISPTKFETVANFFKQNIPTSDIKKFGNWDLEASTLFCGYQSFDAMVFAITKSQNNVLIRISNFETASLKVLSQQSQIQIDQTVSSLNGKIKQIADGKTVFLTGVTGGGKTTILNTLIDTVRDEYSIVYVNPRLFPTRASIIYSIFESLLVTLSQEENTENFIARERRICRACGVQYSIFRLLQKRADWLFIFDSLGAFRTEFDSIFYRNMHENDFSTLIDFVPPTNKSFKYKTIVALEKTPVAKSQQIEQVYISAPEVNIDRLKDTLIGSRLALPSLGHLLRRADIATGFVLLDKIIKKLLDKSVQGQTSQANRLNELLTEYADSFKSQVFSEHDFRRYFYTTIKKLFNLQSNRIMHHVFTLICLCCLPEDDIRYSSLEWIMEKYLKFAGDEFIDKIQENRNDFVVPNGRTLNSNSSESITAYFISQIENLGEPFVYVINKSPLTTSQINEKTFKVNSIIKSIVRECWGSSHEGEQQERKRWHYVVGLRALMLSRLPNNLHFKDAARYGSNNIESDPIGISTLSPENKTLLQSIYHLIRSLSKDTTTFKSMNITAKDKVYQKLLNSGYIENPLELINDIYHLVEYFQNRNSAQRYEGFNELNIDILLRLIMVGDERIENLSNEQTPCNLYNHSVPHPSSVILNALGHRCISFYQWIIIAALHVHNYPLAISACEQILWMINSKLFEEISATKERFIRDKIVETYYYISLRTGQFHDAAYYAWKLVCDNAQSYSQAVESGANSTQNFYERKWMSSVTKELVVSVSRMDITNIKACLKSIGNRAINTWIATEFNEFNKHIFGNHSFSSDAVRQSAVKCEIMMALCHKAFDDYATGKSKTLPFRQQLANACITEGSNEFKVWESKVRNTPYALAKKTINLGTIPKRNFDVQFRQIWHHDGKEKLAIGFEHYEAWRSFCNQGKSNIFKAVDFILANENHTVPSEQANFNLDDALANDIELWIESLPHSNRELGKISGSLLDDVIFEPLKIDGIANDLLKPLKAKPTNAKTDNQLLHYVKHHINKVARITIQYIWCLHHTLKGASDAKEHQKRYAHWLKLTRQAVSTQGLQLDEKPNPMEQKILQITQQVAENIKPDLRYWLYKLQSKFSEMANTIHPKDIDQYVYELWKRRILENPIKGIDQLLGEKGIRCVFRLRDQLFNAITKLPKIRYQTDFPSKICNEISNIIDALPSRKFHKLHIEILKWAENNALSIINQRNQATVKTAPQEMADHTLHVYKTINQELFADTIAECYRLLLRLKAMENLPDNVISKQQVTRISPLTDEYMSNFKKLFEKEYNKVNNISFDNYESSNPQFHYSRYLLYMTKTAQIRFNLLNEKNRGKIKQKLSELMKLTNTKIIDYEWSPRLPGSIRIEIAQEVFRNFLQVEFLTDKYGLIREENAINENVSLAHLQDSIDLACRQTNPKLECKGRLLLLEYLHFKNKNFDRQKKPRINNADMKLIEENEARAILLINEYEYEYKRYELICLERLVQPTQYLPL